MKQRAALAAVLAVGILAGYGILANLPEPLDGEINGTYSCDDAVYTKVIAMDSRDGNAFYYADSKNNLYIKGAFEKKGENVYAVSCDSTADKATIPDQSIVYSDRSFMLTVSGQQLIFRKVHQAPILYGDETVYE